MSGAHLQHQRREKTSQIDPGERAYSPILEAQDLNSIQTPSAAFKPHSPHRSLPSTSDPDTSRDTASACSGSTTLSVEVAPQDAPAISVTPPPCDPPTLHCARHELVSPFQVGAELMAREISQMLLSSRAQFVGHVQRDASLTRTSSSSRSSGLTNAQYDSSLKAARRRYGVVDLLGFGGEFISLTRDEMAHGGGQVDRADSLDDGESRAGSAMNVPGSDLPHDPEDPSEAPHVSDHTKSHDTDRLHDFQDEDAEGTSDTDSIGTWRCCECRKAHHIYRLESSAHLFSALNCSCTHRSCRSCTFTGTIKRFAPIYDPSGLASIPIFEGNDTCIHFGVVCRTCGLSWRAQKIEEQKLHRSLRQRLSVLPKKVNPLQKLRHTKSMIHLSLSSSTQHDDPSAQPSLSASRSVVNLRSAFESQGKCTEPEDQIPGAEVRFYGIECTCGQVTDASSLCFQLVQTPEVERRFGRRDQKGVNEPQAAEWKLTSALQVKGYGTPVLELKGGSHPNPLRSNPA